MSSGCLIVQQPINETTFGCFETVFIVPISLKNSSSSSGEGRSIERIKQRKQHFSFKNQHFQEK